MARLDLLPAVDSPTDQSFGCTAATFEIPWPDCASGYFHTGEDVGDDACYGTPVIATRPGVVAYVGAQPVRWRDGSGWGFNSSSFGGQAVSWCLDGSALLVLVGHLSRADVAAGQRVAAGTQLGLAGGWPNSGQGVTTGPHVHLEVQPWWAHFLDPASALDPSPYLMFEEAEDMPLFLLQATTANGGDGKVYLSDGMRKWYIPDAPALADVVRVFQPRTDAGGAPFQIGSDTEAAIPNAS